MKQFMTSSLSKEERDQQQKQERKRQQGKFSDALTCYLRQLFGAHVEKVHHAVKTVIQEELAEQVERLFKRRIGAFYSTGRGGGKTHLLLEIVCRIATLEWEEETVGGCYPNAPQFLERTCCYLSLQKLVELVRAKEKIRISRYNFIDNLGMDDIPSYGLTALENHLEEIHRQGKAVVLASRQHRDILRKIPSYGGILSHCYEQCDFYQLREQDLRLTAEVVGDPDWRLNR
jgi:hypothetical protein